MCYSVKWSVKSFARSKLYEADSMGEKWSNPPVFYTLAQIKFNPIAQMDEYVPELQDRLRRIGYPDYQPEHKIEVSIRKPASPQPDVRPQQLVRWNFMNIDRTEAYTLLPDALIFHSAMYAHFEDFSEKVLKGLSLVHEVIELAYIQRIGLRYLDAIVPADGDALDNYLNPSLLGLSIATSGELTHSFTETVSQVNRGTLVTRTVITEGGLAMPPDLFPMVLALPDRFGKLSGRIAVLDTDYFVEHRNNFDLNSVKEQLLVSHKIVSDTFKSSVTEHAISNWQ